MKIINDCTNPPWGLIRHVRRALKWIEQSHLESLYCVQLVDELPELVEESPKSVVQAIAAGHLPAGQYMPSDADKPAYIVLFINVIYRVIPPLYRATPVATIRLTDNLYRGVAYHLLASRQYIFEEGDGHGDEKYQSELAREYSLAVLRRMQEKWYYRLAQWAIRDLAETYYIAGMHDWKAKDYKKAAERWSKAWTLNPDHNDASYWYGRAKAMYSTEE